jgi:hypothetical protein
MDRDQLLCEKASFFLAYVHALTPTKSHTPVAFGSGAFVSDNHHQIP